jgi:hypothetical protein
MEPINAGDLVSVATGGPPIDGIVFELLPGSAKAVVAVRDPKRGPVLRSVAQDALSERAEAGPDDRALQLLIRRTPAPTHGAVRGGQGGGSGRAGHTRTAMHRTTGK